VPEIRGIYRRTEGTCVPGRVASIAGNKLIIQMQNNE
jgi:hypothetical protein